MSLFPSMMSGTSYNQFYSLPQWTTSQQQSYSFLQQPHVPPAFSPYSQQYTYTNGLETHPSPQPKIDNNVWQQPIKRKRASRPKVRTGCTTCKIRRVKCDEAKPACLRCTSTGRRCDGYKFPRKDDSASEVNSSASGTPQSSLPPPSTSKNTAQKDKRKPNVLVFSPGLQAVNYAFEGTVQERRAFHRFKYRTVPAFAGGSETEFWTGLVLRAAVSEPVIREAVIALSTLHEDYETHQGCYDQALVTSESYKNTVLLYGKAIRKLYQRIDTVTGETANLAIIASIVFACFEVLRRNDMAAVMHYQNGMRQLMKQMNERSHQRIAKQPSPPSEPTLRCTPQDDLDRMLRVFARYDVQACTFSKLKAEPLNISLSSMPQNEIGLTEVRRYLDNLLVAVYQLVKSDLSMFRYWKSDEVSPAWLERRSEAIKTFQGWLDVLEKSIPSDAVTLRNHGVTASKSILGLVMQIKVAMIMLKTCIDSGPETTFDRFEPEFEEMVSRVENMTRILGLGDGVPLDRETVPFSMELGVIHPLFFIAWKCRNWKIRRRAIAELKKCGKEGVWEGPIMAVVARRLAQIEERGLQPGQFVPEASRIHDLKKGVEYDERVVRVEIRLASDATWKKWTVVREAIPF